MNKKVYLNLLLIIAITYSCSYQNRTTFDPNLTSEIQEAYRTTREWIQKDSIKDAFSYNGEALIVRKVFSLDSTIITEEDMRDVILFKDQSRHILRFFPGYGSTLDYSLSKSEYRLKIHYWHPQGDYGRKGINVDPSKSNLVLNNDNIHLG